MNDINREFGQILRRFRRGRNLPQDKFADQCGISRAYYGRIERGEYSPTITLCHRIATALSITMDDLFRDMPI